MTDDERIDKAQASTVAIVKLLREEYERPSDAILVACLVLSEVGAMASGDEAAFEEALGVARRQFKELREYYKVTQGTVRRS